MWYVEEESMMVDLSRKEHFPAQSGLLALIRLTLGWVNMAPSHLGNATRFERLIYLIIIFAYLSYNPKGEFL